VRFEFNELPGERSRLPRPVLPVQFEDIGDTPQRCLVDTGSTTNRFGIWLAEAAGLDLACVPQDEVVVGGVKTTAKHARAALTIAGHRYDAPVTFCDPWPFPFNLLGQEGFLRFFRVTICAAEYWLEVEPERR
jgi:predicted aspartyl protease